MKLTLQGLNDKQSWEAANYALPRYAIEDMKKNTQRAPQWIHFGGGNLFRAFQAKIADNLLNEGILDRGIITVATSDTAALKAVYHAHDNLSIIATLKSDGTMEKRISASMAETLSMDAEGTDIKRLREIFAAPSLQMVSFTITEKGYRVLDADGKPLPNIAEDLKASPSSAKTYLGRITSFLLHRYEHGGAPLSLVSMDNVAKNGDKLASAIRLFADSWVKEGVAPEDFSAYLRNPSRIAFPYSMIDKITPSPSDDMKRTLDDDGIEEIEPFTTARGSHIAPYVNAEEAEYLVIEDRFPNGRPLLEKGGIIFTDRATVELSEKMKVSCCLNPLHTALAVFGCLLGYTRISSEMKDDDLVQLIKTLGYQEGLPVTKSPKILNPKEFLDTCINLRFPNPFLPDSPQRIATDTSQKLAIRFGETVKAHQAQNTAKSLCAIPLVYAGWLRYLMEVDDEGADMVLSPDPLLPRILPHIKELSFGQKYTAQEIETVLAPILADHSIFGVDLYAAGLVPSICKHLSHMILQKGAVRMELHAL